jgi:hypothetical protein
MDAWSITLYVLSATADVILGAFWYHPRIFGATWVRAMNLSPEMAEHGRRHKHLFTVIAFFASMVTAATLRFIEQIAGVQNALQGIVMGAMVCIGFMLPVLLGQYLWDQKPGRLFLLNAGFWFVSCLMIAIIVSI